MFWRHKTLTNGESLLRYLLQKKSCMSRCHLVFLNLFKHWQWKSYLLAVNSYGKITKLMGPNLMKRKKLREKMIIFIILNCMSPTWPFNINQVSHKAWTFKLKDSSTRELLKMKYKQYVNKPKTSISRKKCIETL